MCIRDRAQEAQELVRSARKVRESLDTPLTPLEEASYRGGFSYPFSPEKEGAGTTEALLAAQESALHAAQELKALKKRKGKSPLRRRK